LVFFDENKSVRIHISSLDYEGGMLELHNVHTSPNLDGLDVDIHSKIEKKWYSFKKQKEDNLSLF